MFRKGVEGVSGRKGLASWRRWTEGEGSPGGWLSGRHSRLSWLGEQGHGNQKGKGRSLFEDNLSWRAAGLVQDEDRLWLRRVGGPQRGQWGPELLLLLIEITVTR